MSPDPGRIATFYSYKGGTGRSMALANFAWIMAASGKKVLAIDWDLEAPGLHRYFRPFLVDPDLFETEGLIDVFWSLTASAMTSNTIQQIALEDSSEIAEALGDATRRLDSKFFPPDGYIDFIGAGRQGGTYSERVNSFDWKRFYELGGAKVLISAKEHLQSRYDWVLIDSRTGVSDTSGICTIQMPQMVVALFTLNRQSIDGVAAILRSIRSYRGKTVDGSKIRFFPIATRIENAEQLRLETARLYARNTLVEFLPSTVQQQPRSYWDKMEISYRPVYAFEEFLAAFGDPSGAAGAADTMLAQMEAMAQQITGDSNLSVAEVEDSERTEVLRKYAFGTVPEIARQEVPTEDTDFLRGLRAKEQMWRTSKFLWRLLLSRRELDLLTDNDRQGFGRNMNYYAIQSERMQQVLRRAKLLDPAIFAAALFVYATLLYGFSPYFRYWFESSDTARVVTIVGSAVLGAWLLSALIWSLTTLQSKPYGMTLLQLFRIFLMGPLSPEIPDFTPDENRRPTAMEDGNS